MTKIGAGHFVSVFFSLHFPLKMPLRRRRFLASITSAALLGGLGSRDIFAYLADSQADGTTKEMTIAAVGKLVRDIAV